MNDRTAPTSRRYTACLARVIDHLHAHLDADLGLERVAEVACLSPSHFHRLYRAVLGETLADTVRRLRIQKASGELLHTDWPLARIGRRAGYGSEAAFNRAFKRVVGMTPAAYRTRREALVAPVPFPPLEIADMPEVTVMDLPETTPLALPHQGDYMGIGHSFERLCAWAGSRGLLGPEVRCLGLYWDDPDATPAAELRSAACIDGPAGAAADGIEVIHLPARRYACLEHVGPYTELPASYRLLYSGWLARSDEAPADAPCVEVYLNDPREVPAIELRTRIMVPLA
ncbi:MAG: AraC family transcriptional regulator [Rhodocyclaceae bacterium]|nr:AraC family transcriptional regulator [Rhodocyclaceae bacterium]